MNNTRIYKNIPRFLDKSTGEPYEMILQCPKCFWVIVYDRVTRYWKNCRLCNTKLERTRSYYAGYYERKPDELEKVK